MHFVEDQQNAEFTAQAFDALEVVRGGRDHAGFALDRLEHDRYGPFIHGRMQRWQVIERNTTEAWQLRLEPVGQCRTVRRRNRRQAPAVATVVGHNDSRRTAAMLLTPFARQFDRRLAGFAAGIEQVGLVTAGAGTQMFGEAEHAAVMQAKTRVDQRLSLGCDCIDQYRRAMTEAVGPAALGKIQVRTVIAVPQP
ncbi:hypothetical protein D3C71_1295370 [compost metagenome]